MTQATATQALTTKTRNDVQATAAPPVALSRRIYNPIQKDAVTFLETTIERDLLERYCR